MFIKKFFKFIFGITSSSKLALLLIIIILIFSVIGASLPQEGVYSSADIAKWQESYPVITSVMKPAGMFRVFHSIPFIIIIFLLLINTLTCTIKEFFKRGWFSAFKGTDKLKNTGFFLLHISILLLIGGGGWSAATKMDAYIILTEGQSIRETHESYNRLIEGPFRKDKHKEFVIRLDSIKTKYEKSIFHIDTTSKLSIFDKGEKKGDFTIKFNEPLTYSGISLTIDETGFSPHLIINNKKNRRILLNSFIALKTFKENNKREYRDFIPVPFFKNLIVITLLPEYERKDGKIKKSGENIIDPIILVEERDKEGNTISKKILPLKTHIELGDHSIYFAGLRQWASFRVVEDPGYLLFGISVWLSILSLLLRYSGELFSLFGSGKKRKN